jgi:hypothetical protein
VRRVVLRDTRGPRRTRMHVGLLTRRSRGAAEDSSARRLCCAGPRRLERGWPACSEPLSIEREQAAAGHGPRVGRDRFDGRITARRDDSGRSARRSARPVREARARHRPLACRQRARLAFSRSRACWLTGPAGRRAGGRAGGSGARAVSAGAGHIDHAQQGGASIYLRLAQVHGHTPAGTPGVCRVETASTDGAWRSA